VTPLDATQAPEVPLAETFGAFHLDALLVRLNVDPLAHLDLARVAGFRAKDPSVWEKVSFALSQTAAAHEARHLHDAFGTRAGINLFLARFSVLQDFVKVGASLTAIGRQWPLPVTRAKNDDLPDFAWKFLKHALDVKLVCSRFEGEMPSVIMPVEDLPDPLPHVSRLRESRLGTVVWAFPAQAIRFLPSGEEVPAIQHVPLAFNALLEGNAQAIQRTFIETTWGPEVAGLAFLRGGETHRAPGEADYAPTYNVSDLMVSRFMRNKGGGAFPRRALLALADHALTAGIQITRGPAGSREVGLACAGEAFVDLLEEVGADAIQADNVPTPHDAAYRQLRDHFAATRPFETADADIARDFERLVDQMPETRRFVASTAELAGPSADVEVLYRWVAREVITPLLDARLETSHRVFSDLLVWGEWYAKRLPPPPFRTLADGTTVSSAPPRVREAWLRVRLIDRILAQLLNGDPAILCPRAHGLAPGLERVNFAHGGSCDDLIAADLCGRFVPGPVVSMPTCRFTDALMQLGFLGPRVEV
jgi:hypothetical protein